MSELTITPQSTANLALFCAAIESGRLSFTLVK